VQTIEQIATALEEFLADNMRSVTLEDGKVLFNMRGRNTGWGPSMAASYRHMRVAIELKADDDLHFAL